jgi:hypothetical protein
MTPNPNRLLAISLMLALSTLGDAGAETIRMPVRAGSFYPSDPR